MNSLFLKVLGSRQGGALLLAASYVLLGSLLRVGLLIASAGEVSWGLSTFASLLVGLAVGIMSLVSMARKLRRK